MNAKHPPTGRCCAVLSRIFAYFATKEAAHSAGNEQLLTFKPAIRAFLSLRVVRHRHWLTGEGYAAVTFFASLGWGTGGIFVNSAFSASGVATLETTIKRMTAVK